MLHPLSIAKISIDSGTKTLDHPRKQLRFDSIQGASNSLFNREFFLLQAQHSPDSRGMQPRKRKEEVRPDTDTRAKDTFGAPNSDSSTTRITTPVSDTFLASNQADIHSSIHFVFLPLSMKAHSERLARLEGVMDRPLKHRQYRPKKPAAPLESPDAS